MKKYICMIFTKLSNFLRKHFPFLAQIKKDSNDLGKKHALLNLL